jgi:L-ribulokinase
MTKDKFAVGVDFGTESGRAVVVRVRDGLEAGAAIVPYPDGVLDERLPDGRLLEPDWALQNPRDYLLVVEKAIPKALKSAGVKSENVIGLGTDFTASSPMPTLGDGTPLCFVKQFGNDPHAWVKLWKHHAAQPEANRISEIGTDRHEEFIHIYGGRYSSEWFFSKLLQILDESPKTYAATRRFIEAGDWIVWQLTGEEKRSACTASYKAMWVKGAGFPSNDFFVALHPRFEDVVQEKMGETYYPLGSCAGGLTPYWAKKTGLRPGTPVSIGNVDAHVSVPAVTVAQPGSMVMIMGTSICHILLGEDKRMVEGMCGTVEDGVVPGLWGYEAGQSAVGDIFAWYFQQGVPGAFEREARQLKTAVPDLLEKRAGALKAGQSGLLALDWWNGNRSVLVDADLMGLLVGLRLGTKPEEIFRALIEATAFGTRQIIEAFESQGIPVKNLVACGGLPDKNKLLMQIYADVTGKEIKIARQPLTCPALGSAMHGAVAAGRAGGGYDSIFEAAKRMAGFQRVVYRPHPRNQQIYTGLFKDYQKLHDYFGRGENDVMKRLKAIQREVVHSGRGRRKAVGSRQ